MYAKMMKLAWIIRWMGRIIMKYTTLHGYKCDSGFMGVCCYADDLSFLCPSFI